QPQTAYAKSRNDNIAVAASRIRGADHIGRLLADAPRRYRRGSRFASHYRAEYQRRCPSLLESLYVVGPAAVRDDLFRRAISSVVAIRGILSDNVSRYFHYYVILCCSRRIIPVRTPHRHDSAPADNLPTALPPWRVSTFHPATPSP